jgi:hypothetical protein
MATACHVFYDCGAVVAVFYFTAGIWCSIRGMVRESKQPPKDPG